MTSTSEKGKKIGPVLIIGGRGFVGSEIVRRIANRGLAVHVFGPAMEVDLLSDLSGRFTETNGSVEDRAAVRAAIRTSGARTVVTTAAHSAGRQGLMRSGDAETDRAFSVNVSGLRNVFEAAREAAIERVVWTGSTVVYGPAGHYSQKRVDEDAATGPVTVYGLTKLLGENLARYYRDRYGMAVTGLRLPLLLGPGLWYQGAASAIMGMIKAAAPGAHHTVAFHDDPTDLMHVGDAAEAVTTAMESAHGLAPVYNVNGFTARMSDIIASLESRVPGYSVTHVHQPAALTFPLIDDGRFRRDTSFSPAFGLQEVIGELLQNREEECTKNA